jgi:CheY-like chemotaxis protein
MRKHFSILVAEDNDGHFVLIKRFLREMGFKSKIRRFIDGQQALDFLLEYNKLKDDADPVNYLLILDIRMPKIDGVEVLEQIKKYPKLKAIPVVMLTSSGSPSDIKRCAKMGCQDYVLKPLDGDDFQGVIKRVAATLLTSILETSVA